MSGTCIGHIMRASVTPCLGHGIGIETRASIRESQCKTMSETWHRLNMRVSIRPCLGHGIDLT
ncbi:mitochondrial outer membrane iml2 [Gossypium arboreum]|uniref:Mitochondrial outer membrane iml2 n=1 Tax=Gossypium arboreum TaxID=29729 RepID=A0A0B0MWE9_GOSAR|nr:mitochondrial outer membrane iml2 [Gossypium arboreum]